MKYFLMVFLALTATTACGQGDDRGGDRNFHITGLNGAVASQNHVYLAKITWEGELKPGNDAFNTAVVTIAPASGDLVAASLDSFHLMMPSMGHGTNEVHQKIENGSASNEFKVTGIHFLMAGAEGEWVADITATVNGRQDTVSIPVPEVR